MTLSCHSYYSSQGPFVFYLFIFQLYNICAFTTYVSPSYCVPFFYLRMYSVFCKTLHRLLPLGFLYWKPVFIFNSIPSRITYRPPSRVHFRGSEPTISSRSYCWFNLPSPVKSFLLSPSPTSISVSQNPKSETIFLTQNRTHTVLRDLSLELTV